MIFSILIGVFGIFIGAGLSWLYFKSKVSDEKSQWLSQISVLETTLKLEREQWAQKEVLLQQTEKKLVETFQSLSATALKDNNQAFLVLAENKLSEFQKQAEANLTGKQKEFQTLVTPIKESLSKFEKSITDLETKRVAAYSSIAQQVTTLIDSQQTLRQETSKLVRALSSSSVRGRWGEMQLKRVVELAGMLNYCDFLEQQNVDTEEGRLRPDMIIRLVGGKTIVVDSKTSLSAYLEALEATDEVTRKRKLEDHARQIKTHLLDLGRKAYWDQFKPSPEFVVMFIPGEVFFSAALEQDPSLLELGMNQKVILASPTSLISLLKAAAYGWRQEDIEREAQKISELGKELYERLNVLAGHFSGIGKSLNSAVESYNRTINSLESRVLVSGRKFKELKSIGLEKEIEVLAPVEKTAQVGEEE